MIQGFKRTDDVQEMIALGKKIVADMSDTYTPAVQRANIVKIARAMKNTTPQQREEIFYQSVYDYWAYGTNQSEEIFYGFLDMKDAEKQEYLTFRNRFDYYYLLNDKKASHILNNKFETFMRFKEDFKREVIQIRDDSDFDRFVGFVGKHPEFVVKPSSLGLTIGVYKESALGCADLKKKFDSILEKGGNTKKKNAWGDSWEHDNDCSVVLEELIEQDEAMEPIHPYSINGVRILTIYATGGAVKVFYPWLKIGNQGKFITAEAFGSLMAGINAETGIVDTDGIDELGTVYKHHPLTGVKIKGYVIPRWDECVELVTKLAKDLHKDGINYVGWDMALTKQGWSIIEGNFDGEFLGQLVYHKGIKKELEGLIGRKPEKEFWWQP